MDITPPRTFLEVSASGSFISAAERLHLTQTAVSARIRTLEEQPGRRLFVRNKAGARLTTAGERFVGHATTLVQVWEQARQHVALPPGREEGVSLGGELSLWHPLLADWLIRMHRECPQIALRAEVDCPMRLLDRVHEGSLDIAVLYNPPQRPDLVSELLVEEKLVMVTSAPDGQIDPAQYVYVALSTASGRGCGPSPLLMTNRARTKRWAHGRQFAAVGGARIGANPSRSGDGACTFYRHVHPECLLRSGDHREEPTVIRSVTSFGMSTGSGPNTPAGI
ncbi:LysR family transcriptional regulator [Paraburkholderia atlantica]|uniref:LysR family transcriptional regulator n=1 Tax=Paraburkholderia atlantica TaxID=2654982 RepID=UPI0016149CAC|nr:LysR family transcriptional regulator [Paraburkholderia atlantica]MBB5414867.1 DNA-binding transcriptional LysR family regulator [Paraburkholderia atlantica]